MFELYKLPPTNGMHWPPVMHIMLKRALDARYIAIHKPNGTVSSLGMQISPDIIALTPEGRAFIDELGTSEL